MKVGIMLGSFDPIHVGHVAVLTQVLNDNLVDMILVVPAVQNPFKVNPPASFDIRCQMIQSEIDNLGELREKVVLYRGEESVDLPAYSYKVLSKIRKDFEGEEFFIICGTDIINEIERWKNFKTDILPYFKYIEIGRNVGFVEDGHFQVNVNGGALDVTRLSNSIQAISSTLIRSLCGEGKCPLPLISNNVYSIIKSNSLYGRN